MSSPNQENLEILIKAIEEADRALEISDQEILVAKSEEDSWESLDKDEKLSAKDLEIAQLEAELDRYKQETKQKRKYAKKIFNFLVAWSIAILIIVLLQGFDENHNFELSDKVLVTLIGGTTIEVIGLFTIVASYLFPRTGNKKKV